MLGEYFLGSDSRKMFDEQAKFYSGNLDSPNREARLDYLKRWENIYLFLSRHIPNLITCGSLVYSFFSGKPPYLALVGEIYRAVEIRDEIVYNRFRDFLEKDKNAIAALMGLKKAANRTAEKIGALNPFQELRQEVDNLRVGLQTEFQGLNGRIKQQFYKLQGELQKEFQGLKASLADLRQDLTELRLDTENAQQIDAIFPEHEAGDEQDIDSIISAEHPPEDLDPIDEEEEMGQLVDMIFDEKDSESDESDDEPKNPWKNPEDWWKG